MLGIGRNGPALTVASFRDANGATTVVWNGKLLVAEADGGWYGAPPGGCSPEPGSRGASDAAREPVEGPACVCVPSYVVITNPVSSADRSTRFRTGHFGFVHR